MKRRRRGTSLVEVMVVITLSGILISATGICLHGLYRVEQDVREATVRRSAIDRLSLQFRIDAHTASEARVLADGTDSKPKLEFSSLNGMTVTYYQQNHQIVRTLRRADAVLHRDAYRIGRKHVASWRVEAGDPPTASVELVRKPPARSEAGHEPSQRIMAVVGLHASLLASSSTSSSPVGDR